MTTPDWVREGDAAYVISSTMIAGVGSYDTATKVTIVKVTARDIRVAPHGVSPEGNTARFRTSDLTAPRSGGRWVRDDVLVEPGDRRVANARARVLAVVALGRANAVINAGANRLGGRSMLTDSIVEDIDAELVELAAIRDAATEAHTKLLRAREVAR